MILFVKRGQQLTAALWNAFWAERRRYRIRAGPGVHVDDRADGQLISFRGGGGAYNGFFPISIGGKFCRIGEGYVNGLIPEIDGVPIIGSEGSPQPKLELSDGGEYFDETGRSFIGLKSTINPESGRIVERAADGTGEMGLTIVQRKSMPATDPDDDTIGYCRLAVLYRGEKATSGFGRLVRIGLFNYQHRTAKQGDKWRHFFDPA